MRLRSRRVPLLVLAAITAVLPARGADTLAAQDVELLARVYGTPLPDGYHRTLAEYPRAFEFSTGRTLRLQDRLREVESRLGPGSGAGEPGVRLLAALAGVEGSVTGDFRIPVLLGLFSDSPLDRVPFPRDQVQAAYFGEGAGTITHFYREVSGERVALLGELRDWQRSGLTQAAATGGQSGLVSRTTGAFIMDLLRQIPADFNWGVYDNDGPDGVPNSGDDDGFVDALGVLHPTLGAECSSSADRPNRIWSHRWSLRYAAGEVFVTTTPRPNGGTIRVDDYVIQPILSCEDGVSLNEIGVFAHELGHAFGLPDLYDTRSSGTHAGVGNWDLMATGSWGCNGQSPESPCHMGAWSKMILGWADVETLPADTDLGTLTLPSVVSSGKVLRVNAGDGSGEFYLLENRQREGFDARLPNDGLLVWRVSQPLVESRWGGNRVNASSRLGVWLREADGLNELATSGCGRGNAGDPFPLVGPFTGRCGSRADDNRLFHAASNPSSVSDTGTASGLTLLDIRKDAGLVSFRASTRFSRVSVRSEGASGVGGLFTLDGISRPESGFTFQSAPFKRFTVEAVAGESVAPGVRRPFTGWADDAQAPRVRVVDTPLQDLELVARFGGEEVELAMTLQGGQGEIAPGTVETTGRADLWFPRGVPVTVEAKPRRGFTFVRWGGALQGRPNPATITLDGPVQATAVFELTYRVAATTVRIEAAADQLFNLEPENGTAPYAWTIVEGRVPEGLNINTLGQVTGAAMETGAFTLTVEVTDGIGLKAAGSFTLQVDEAVIPVSALASRFLGTGPPLTLSQGRYVDLKGNNDGVYDLGDFRAWVLAHPGLPLTGPVRALVGPVRVVIPMAPPGSGSEVRR